MAKFSSLINDIYKLFDRPHELSEDDLEIFGEACKDALRSVFSKQQDRHPGEKKLRLSKIGLPSRKLWFDIHSKPVVGGGKPSDQIRFIFGHLLEQLILLLAKEAGHDVAQEQARVEVDGVIGHKDCTIDGMTVDIKTASSFSFKKFQNGDFLLDNDGDAFGYKYQIAAYAHKDNEDKAGFLVINKENGELCSVILGREDFPDIHYKIEQERINLSQEQPPIEKCYPEVKSGASGNMILHKLCTFCDYKERCWVDANEGKGLIKFNYASGPVWFTKMPRRPNAMEPDEIQE